MILAIIWETVKNCTDFELEGMKTEAKLEFWIKRITLNIICIDNSCEYKIELFRLEIQKHFSRKTKSKLKEIILKKNLKRKWRFSYWVNISNLKFINSLSNFKIQNSLAEQILNSTDIITGLRFGPGPFLIFDLLLLF